MKKLTTIAVLIAVVGCGRNPTQLGASVDAFPVIDPNDRESINRWESSPYNYSNSKISVAQLRRLHGTLGDSSREESKAVAIEVVEAKTGGITQQQQSAIDSLISNEAEAYAEIRRSLYEYYQENYAAYKEGWTMGIAMFGGAPSDIEDVLPAIAEGNELDALVQFGSILIHPSTHGLAEIGMTFEVPWDEEHGIGLRLLDGKVQAIGIAHEAYPVP